MTQELRTKEEPSILLDTLSTQGAIEFSAPDSDGDVEIYLHDECMTKFINRSQAVRLHGWLTKVLSP